jgi:type II secretory pathway predicted ATPase ExeA
MYMTYFGFREHPFSPASEPRFFYTNPLYEEAYKSILTAIRERKGFILLTGEAGTGKTSLLRLIADSLEDTVHGVVFHDRTPTFEKLLTSLCQQLALYVDHRDSSAQLNELHASLHAWAYHGDSAVLFIDDAHKLDQATLDRLHVLLALEGFHKKLLSVVLAGQPELEAKLAQPELRHIQRQVAVHCRLTPLSEEEVGPFIHHQFRAAGRERQDLFAPEAIRSIACHARGIPWLINVICDNALFAAYTAGQQTVSPAIIEGVTHNLPLKKEPRVSKEQPSASQPTRQTRERKKPSPPPSRSSRQVIWAGIGILFAWFFFAEQQPTSWLGKVLSKHTSEVPVEAVPFEATPPAHRARQSDQELSKEGAAVLGVIAQRYPDVRPVVWGLATANPTLVLVIPETEWAKLSKLDQVSLTLYLERLIPTLRTTPDKYIGLFRPAPLDRTLREKLTSLCADCWVIGVGRLTINGRGALLDKIMVQGDSVWEKSNPPSKGTKASEFRQGISVVGSIRN